MKRARRMWLVSAVCIVIAGVVGGFLYWRAVAAPATLPKKVVVVFAMPGEDQAVVAQLVVTVDTTAKTYTVSDPNATVQVPGTSYDRLRDAYPFGGAELVTKALLGDTAKEAGWVQVSPQAWKRLLAAGFSVNLSEGFQAFNEKTERYSQFEVGPQHVSVDDLEGFVNGAPYTQDTARMEAEKQLAAVSFNALAATHDRSGIESNVTAGLLVELESVLADSRPAGE